MSDKYSILVQARNRETEQGGGGVVLRMTYIQPVDSDFCRSSNLHTRKSQMKDNSARTRLSFLYLITYSTGNNYAFFQAYKGDNSRLGAWRKR